MKTISAITAIMIAITAWTIFGRHGPEHSVVCKTGTVSVEFPVDFVRWERAELFYQFTDEVCR